MTTPFSQTIVRDTFTRANSGTLGANWTANSDAVNTGTIGITSNVARPATLNANCAAFWSANTFTANQYAQCIVSASALGQATAADGGPTVRDSAAGCYRFITVNNGPETWQLAKIVNGAFASLGGGTAGVSGSLLRLEAIGTQLTGFIDGVQVVQVNDSDLPTGGPGIAAFQGSASPTVSITSWEGGNLLWTRQGTVIPVGASNGNQEPLVAYEANPQILSANADGKIWKMWYSTGWVSPVPAINYAESPDGITWTQFSGNPVASGGANGVAHGSVLHIGNTYYGFFGDVAESTINRWTSANGTTWTKTNSNVLTPTAATWDSGGVANPVITVVGNTWNMLYEGKSVTLASVGLATSTDLGVTWTKYVSNPVITSASASTSMGKTPPILDGNLYYLWTHATLANSNLPSDMSLFSSPDLHTWTACPKNAVYERVLANEGANLATGQAADPCLVELNGTTYQFYSASPLQASGNFHINLATAPFSRLQLMGIVFGQNIIYGSVGVAGATVNYSGPSSGSVTADASGNYVIPVQSNGTYTVTPSPAGGTFTPTSQPAVVSSADVAANFTGTPPALAYSVPDCRVAPFGPNASRSVQATLIYDVQTSSNPAVPSTDSRVRGAPVDSRISPNTPQNSRTPGLYGPGE